MSAMVLFAFEQDLSNFIINRIGDDHDSETISDLIGVGSDTKRTTERRKQGTKASLSDAYLDEVFRGALNVAKSTSSESDLLYLKKLFSNLDLFAVRNAIAHPNKPFLLCYWHRAAVLATDPATERLGFRATIEGYGRAQDGKLIEIPDYWYSAAIEIPNNLPQETGHELTGLVGRKQELAELGKLLKSQRIPLVAVVAPGGVGKTALILDYLRSLVLDEIYAEQLIGVLYVTLKPERLTADGIVRLSPVESLKELTNQIVLEAKGCFDTQANTFSELADELNSKSILLCIDNLETLLRDNQQEFEQFNYSLPGCWRVLVTSRVSVPSAALLSLSPLQDAAGQHLAKTYSSRRGVGLSQDSAIEITSACRCNPLAIRLSIDLLARGVEITEAITKAKKELGEFSYGVLLDCLTDNEICVLESLMAEQSLNRDGVVDYTSLTVDHAQEAINSLMKTSLMECTHNQDSTRFSLPPGVRDVLLTYSRAVEVRKMYSAEATKANAKIQARRAAYGSKMQNPFDESFIPSDISPKLQELVVRANQILFQRRVRPESLAGILVELQTSLRSSGSWFIWRTLGRVHSKLSNNEGWETAYKNSLELKPDPYTYFLLANGYYSSGEYIRAEEVYAKLQQDGYFDPKNSDVNFACIVCTGFFLSKLFQGKLDDVLVLTENFPYPELASRYSLFRSGAFKRKAEGHSANSEEFWTNTTEAVHCLNFALQKDGYAKHVKKVLRNTITFIGMAFRYEFECGEQFKIKIENCLVFCADHILGAFHEGTQETASIREIVRNLEKYNSANNPFKSDVRWSLLLGSAGSNSEIESMDQGGLIIANVYNIMCLKKGFIFARDVTGKQYYLHFNEFQNGQEHWKAIANGQAVAIDCDGVEPAEGKAIRAKLWLLVD